MKQTLVSWEVASLLRKHRFHEPVEAHYDASGILHEISEQGAVNWNQPLYDKNVRHKVFSSPSLAMAQQWLREKKHYDVLVSREYFCGNLGKYYATIIRQRDHGISETRRFRSYDKALEAGILKALKTIAVK